MSKKVKNSTPTVSPDANDSSHEDIEPVIYARDEHCISRTNIDPDALKIMYRLHRHGYKAYLVGGGVRDLLLRKKPKDFDIATDATPNKIKALFRNCRIIGRRFKLAHIYFHNRKIIETSTFRDFSSPFSEEDRIGLEDLMITRDNKYGTESTDAVRRDITINALFYDIATFSIIDYVGGMPDLQDGVVRVIGDPCLRFAEDPVRLMRVVRHAARANFKIEEKCYGSILDNHELITHSSPVRLYEELKKDFSSGYALRILRLLNETTLLQHLLPELNHNNGILLSDEHELSHSLARMDNLFRSGGSCSITAILAAMSLFFGDHTLKICELADQFMNENQIHDYLLGCFEKLAVPRKERERITATLNLWHSLENTPIEKIRIGVLKRRRHLNDLYDLLRILREDSRSDGLLAIVTTAVNERRHETKKRSKTKRKKRSKRKGPVNKMRPVRYTGKH